MGDSLDISWTTCNVDYSTAIKIIFKRGQKSIDMKKCSCHIVEWENQFSEKSVKNNLILNIHTQISFKYKILNSKT